MTEEIYALWFNNIKGLGNKGKAVLLSKLGAYEEIFNASEEIYSKLVNDKIKKSILKSKNLDEILRIDERLKNQNIKYTYIGHEEYPSVLLNIYDFPFILYYKGKKPKKMIEKNRNIAVVGSRNASFYGKEIAYSFSKRLSEEKINIVSGLAYGIDAAGHRGALEGNGYTIGVLGCGINMVYPNSSSELFRMLEEKGTIISEYGLDVNPNPGLFPQRNRIISGLSDGVLVVEAEKRSGSLITADFALEQGKVVMAIPGRITDLKSQGCNNLIKMGGYCINEYNDIMESMGIEIPSGEKNSNINIESKNEEKENSLAPLEKIVYSCVSLEPIYIDDILYKTNIKVTDLINILLGLENKKIIKQPVKGYYIINI